MEKSQIEETGIIDGDLVMVVYRELGSSYRKVIAGVYEAMPTEDFGFTISPKVEIGNAQLKLYETPNIRFSKMNNREKALSIRKLLDGGDLRSIVLEDIK